MEKKCNMIKKFGKTLLMTLPVVVVGYIWTGVAISQSKSIALPLTLASVLFLGWWICGSIWVGNLLPFLRSVEWLKKNGFEDVADDISLDQPTFSKAKIYCGEKALFCQKMNCIIPYTEVVWVHMYEKSAYGVTVEKKAAIHLKDGKKYYLGITVEDVQHLLGKHILQHVPNVIVGYGAEQKARYYQMYPQAKEPIQKAKRSCGISLMGVGGALLVAMLINIKSAQIVPLTIFILLFFAAGALLYWLGKKK